MKDMVLKLVEPSQNGVLIVNAFQFGRSVVLHQFLWSDELFLFDAFLELFAIEFLLLL